MALQDDLKELVSLYATFDKEKNEYLLKFEKIDLVKLDIHFIRLINKHLLVTGTDKSALKKQYNKLSIYFHPDKKSLHLPAVIWLEGQLSEGRNNGICFQTLISCHEKLSEPSRFKNMEFYDIKSREDCRVWLEKSKGKAQTYSEQKLYESLISLLSQATSFFDETGSIKPQGLKTVLNFIPTTLASYGAILVAEELLAIYALCFVVIKGGKYLSQSDYMELKQLGSSMKKTTQFTAAMTTVLLVHLLEMSFWTSRKCLKGSLKIGTVFLKTMKYVAEPLSADETKLATQLCDELMSASQNTESVHSFKTPELKVIAAPIEKHILLTKRQFFFAYRQGRVKTEHLDDFLADLKKIDSAEKSLDDKLKEASAQLQILKNKKEIYKVNTKVLLDNTEKIINFFQSATCQALVPTQKQETQEPSNALNQSQPLEFTP